MSTGPVGSRVSSNISAAALEYLAISSMAMVSPRMPAPDPPRFSGMHRPSSPASRNASKRSVGYSPDLSISRARGLTLSWARRRTDAWSSRSSAGSSKFTVGTLAKPCRRSRGGSGRLPALADDPAALPLGHASPDPLVLAMGQGVLEAGLADRALGTDLLGFGCVEVLIGGRVEDLVVETSAGSTLAPRRGTHRKSTSSLQTVRLGPTGAGGTARRFVPAPNSAERRV